MKNTQKDRFEKKLISFFREWDKKKPLTMLEWQEFSARPKCGITTVYALYALWNSIFKYGFNNSIVANILDIIERNIISSKYANTLLKFTFLNIIIHTP